jgi:hypothetical protein
MRAWDDHDKFKDDRSTSIGQVNRIRRFDEIVSSDSPSLAADKMRFQLYKSVGGYILESSVYNRREDENQHTLYMIKEEEDFATQVAHAIMMEMMKS